MEHRNGRDTAWFESSHAATDGLHRFYTPWGKYDAPITAFLESVVMNGGSDEDTGSTEWDVYLSRVGRRIVSSDDRGFVGSHRYATEDEAREVMGRAATAYYRWEEEIPSEVTDLSDDGETVEVEVDGKTETYRLRIEPDDCGIDDIGGDWFGEISGPYSYTDDRGKNRPSSFTGNAEKLQSDRSGFVWWQPPADVQRGTEAFTKLRTALRDILEMGYSVVILERLEGSDAYGRAIVADVASLGGVEPMPSSEYVSEILADLFVEIREQRQEQRQEQRGEVDA